MFRGMLSYILPYNAYCIIKTDIKNITASCTNCNNLNSTQYTPIISVTF